VPVVQSAAGILWHADQPARARPSSVGFGGDARSARHLPLANGHRPARVRSYDLLSVPALANFSGLSAEQGQRAFASADGTFRLIYVQARPDLAGYRECSDWLKSIKTTVAGVRTNQADWAEVVVRYTGRPAFVTEIAGNMQRDLSGSVTATAAIIALLFWLMHRRWLPVLWLLTLLALILVATLALGGLILDRFAW